MISLKVSGNPEKSLHVTVKAKNQHWMWNVTFNCSGSTALETNMAAMNSEHFRKPLWVNTVNFCIYKCKLRYFAPCNAKYINNTQKLWDGLVLLSKESAVKSTPPTKGQPLSVSTVNVRKALMRVTVSKAVEPNNNPGLQTMMEIYIRKKSTMLQGGAERDNPVCTILKAFFTPESLKNICVFVTLFCYFLYIWSDEFHFHVAMMQARYTKLPKSIVVTYTSRKTLCLETLVYCQFISVVPSLILSESNWKVSVFCTFF